MTERRTMYTTDSTDSALVKAFQARPQDEQGLEDAIADLRRDAEQDAAALLGNAGDLGADGRLWEYGL